MLFLQIIDIFWNMNDSNSLDLFRIPPILIFLFKYMLFLQIIDIFWNMNDSNSLD